MFYENNYSIIIFIFLIISCNTNTKKVSNLESGDSIVFKTQLLDSTNRIPYYQCDEFSGFEIEPTILYINNKYGDLLICTKEPIVNRHDSTIIDTAYISI